MEFLVRIATRIPPGADVGAASAAELERGVELLKRGSIDRIWRIPGRHENVGIWRATDATDLHEMLTSLPLHLYQDVRVEPLAAHPVELEGRRRQFTTERST